ncbi:MAG TPA: hypothetical protein V6C72_01485 [Chroococcales cyanobacterium]
MSDRTVDPQDNGQPTDSDNDRLDVSSARKPIEPRSKDSRQELLDTYIGSVVHGPLAAKRFNDLIAKTLKLKPEG